MLQVLGQVNTQLRIVIGWVATQLINYRTHLRLSNLQILISAVAFAVIWTLIVIVFSSRKLMPVTEKHVIPISPKSNRIDQLMHEGHRSIEIRISRNGVEIVE